jgi:hypothetical protein
MQKEREIKKLAKEKKYGQKGQCWNFRTIYGGLGTE